MTLSTDLYIHDEVDRLEVFHQAQELLALGDNPTRLEPTRAAYEDREWSFGTRDQGMRWLGNAPGQGFCAWVSLTYREGRALTTAEEAAAHDEDCEPDCDGHHTWRPACWLNVNFDTAYSYHDAQGGCGALHARILFAFGQWLDERRLNWSWQNEFTGEVWSGRRAYARLADLIDSGEQANRWFTETVEPAILGHIANERSNP